MANQEQLKILKSGVENWNIWRRENPNIMSDLRGADLKQIDLRRVNFKGTNLEEVKFHGADLSGADLKEAKLFRAKINGANLSMANLYRAELGRATIVESDLKGASLIGASLTLSKLTKTDLCGSLLIGTKIHSTDLKNTNFNMANLGYTSFAGVDLTFAINLNTCKHLNNSFVDYYTLSKSKTLPLNFLRGCGLSDTYIQYIPSLFEQPLQFYSCFISYSTKDQAFAERLYSDLQNKGIRAWYAPHELKAGQKIIDQIDTGIKVTDKLLLILSENSIGSEWVKTEITKAYKKSDQLGKQVLFPISITSYNKLKEWEFYYSGKDMSQEIRDFYLLNFENWKDHDDYKRNFDKLVESLRIEAEG